MRSLLEKLIVTLVLLPSFVYCQSNKKQNGEHSKKPNVLIIIADDLGWNDVSFNGSDIKTPHIDSLARISTILNRFYVAPQCSPTRAGLMTGKYPGRFGMRYGVVAPTVKGGLPSKEVTLAEVFGDLGYQNRAAFGKWHLGHSSLEYHPLNQGFTYFYGHYNGAIDYFTHKRDAELDWHENFEPNLDKGYSTDLIAEKASKFILEQESDNPFLAYVAFNAPHSPMQAKIEDLITYGYSVDNETEEYPIGGQQEGERETAVYGMQGRGNTLRQTFSGMVAAMDKGIGKIINALKASGQFENTIIWFLSDNGGTYKYGGNNKPLSGQKHQLWEGGVRVVSFYKGVGKKSKTRESDEPLAYIDVLPTLFEIVTDSSYTNSIDGINAIRQLSDKPSPERFIYLGKGGLVSKKWKLVKGQLFDIENDISEKNDISTKHPKQFDTLSNILIDFEKIDVGQYEYQNKDWLPPKNWTIE